MLTIQPNFSKRIHSFQAFGNQTAVMIIPKTEVLPEDNYIDYEIIGPSRGNRDEFEREVVDAEFEEITDEDAPKNTTALAVREQNTPVKNNAQEDNLNDIKDNINATMDNLKEVQKERFQRQPAAVYYRKAFFLPQKAMGHKLLLWN